MWPGVDWTPGYHLGGQWIIWGPAALPCSSVYSQCLGEKDAAGRRFRCERFSCRSAREETSSDCRVQTAADELKARLDWWTLISPNTVPLQSWWAQHHSLTVLEDGFGSTQNQMNSERQLLQYLHCVYEIICLFFFIISWLWCFGSSVWMWYIVWALIFPLYCFTDRFLEDFDGVGFLGLFLLTAIHDGRRSSERKRKAIKPEHRAGTWISGTWKPARAALKSDLFSLDFTTNGTLQIHGWLLGLQSLKVRQHYS